MISLVFPQDQMLGKLLLPTISVTLVKHAIQASPDRNVIGRLLDPSPTLLRETLISSGQLRCKNEYRGGTTLVRGIILAGEAGQECSWSVGGMEVRVSVSVLPSDRYVSHRLSSI